MKTTKELIKINLAFIIGITANWILKTFGNVDSFYIFLYLLLIPLNIYLILPDKDKQK